MKKNTHIWGIHYDWHPHPTIGEAYHHYYVGVAYEAPDWSRQSTVTVIKPIDDYYLVSFDNGVDIQVNNVNKIIIIPNEFSTETQGNG